MKAGKAPGPSGRVVEIIRAAGDMGASHLWPCSCNHSRLQGTLLLGAEFHCLPLQGKGGCIGKGQWYCGLKLTEQVMKVLERIVDGLIRQLVSIGDSQFGFVSGRGTTDAIFNVRQLQKKYLAANKRLYMAFIDLEKAFDRVPRKVLRKLGVEEWIVRLVQGMYASAQSRVCVGEEYSEEFEVKVCVHQGSVLSRLLFIIVLEDLSWEFHSGVPWEDLYANDLVIIAELLEEYVRRLLTRKEAMEKKGLSKCRKDEDHDLRYRPGPPAEFRRVSMRRLSHWSGQQQHLLQRLQALGAQEMQWAQVLDKSPWLQMYTVLRNCTSLGRQTTEESPCGTWQAGGGSFLLLTRRHAFSSRWLLTFSHNTCENRLEEVQRSATSSLFMPPLFQDMWPCVQLLCAECNAPCQWDLAIDKTKHPTFAAEWRQWSDRSAMSGRKTLSPPGPMNYFSGLALRIWTSFWRREGSASMEMWNAPMVHSRQPFTHRLKESMGLEAQDNMEAADREGLQRVEALSCQPSW